MVWEEITPSEGPSERGYHAMATLDDGQVILFGGGATKNRYNNETWLYDVKLNSWTQLFP
jgi:hypothetical protein